MEITLLKELKSYQSAFFKSDLLAGITVAVMLVPQGMAYAMLAGLPPIYGLYAGLIPLLIYPLFGSSPYLSVGPVAIVSILILSGLSELATPFSPEFIQLVILTSFLAGIFQVLLSVFRMGFLVNFLSHPVIAGFSSAAAFIIGISQFKHILGIEITAGANTLQTLKELCFNLSESNMQALLIGGLGFLLLVLLKKLNNKIPGALILVILSIVVVIITQWNKEGLAIVGAVPSGLPGFQLPMIDITSVIKVLPLAILIALVSFIESIAIAKTLAAKSGTHQIDANKELLGLGLAKLGGALFQAFPNTGSFSRSAINEQAGGKTGLSSILASFFVGLTLLFFTSFFFHLPKAALAAIVLAAIIGLVDYKEAKHLFKTDRKDFYVMLLTFILTLLLGVQYGVLAGIILSLIMMIYKVSTPHYAVMGRLPNSGVFRNVERYNTAIECKGHLIMRYDDDIFFGNADHFNQAIITEINKRPETKYLILDVSSISNIDSTGMQQFKLLLEVLKRRNIEVHLAKPRGPMRDLFKLHDINGVVDDNIHLNVNTAIDIIEEKH